MVNTYKNELKELKGSIATWNKEILKIQVSEETNANVERLRRVVRIGDASDRILEITGRTKFYNTNSVN